MTCGDKEKIVGIGNKWEFGKSGKNESGETGTKRTLDRFQDRSPHFNDAAVKKVRLAQESNMDFDIKANL
jgi:hypothetical protein